MKTTYLVIGDVLADVTTFGACNRLAPENENVPVFTPHSFAVSAGGAGRVYRQLYELAPGQTYFASAVGGPYEDRLRRELGTLLAPELLLSSPGSVEYKRRFVTSSGLLFRYDMTVDEQLLSDCNQLPGRVNDWLKSRPDDEHVVVVLADYAKGVLDSHSWSQVNATLRSRSHLLVSDLCPPGPYEARRNLCRGLTAVVKANLATVRDTCANLGERVAAIGQVVTFNSSRRAEPFHTNFDRNAAATILDPYRKALFRWLRFDDVVASVITLGAGGAMAATELARTGSEHILHVESRRPQGVGTASPCGCGDIFLAFLAHRLGVDALPSWEQIAKAVNVANAAATEFAYSATDNVVSAAKRWEGV